MGSTADWGEHDRYYGTGSGWTVGNGRFPLSLSSLCVSDRGIWADWVHVVAADDVPTTSTTRATNRYSGRIYAEDRHAFYRAGDAGFDHEV